jgi:hypothetical protein
MSRTATEHGLLTPVLPGDASEEVEDDAEEAAVIDALRQAIEDKDDGIEIDDYEREVRAARAKRGDERGAPIA